jgi:hypothetical protein
MLQSLCRSALASAAIVAVALAATDAAFAAGQRSFVSTSGVDNPACSIGSPCRTFGAAVTATSAGGEVIVLDSGGYGPVTITQSISIIAAPGVYAGVSVASGAGINVTTASTDSVTLRGLTINNTGTGSHGIGFGGDGRLQVEDVNVSGFSVEGLIFTPPTSGDLVVLRSSFFGNGWGIVVTPGGTANAVIDRVATHHNAQSGVQVGERAAVVVRDSVVSNNNQGVWCYGFAGGTTGTCSVESSDVSHNGQGVLAGVFAGTGTVSVSNSVVSQNGNGISAQQGGIVTLAGTTVTRNTNGIVYGGTGVADSQGNNLISGNTTNGTAPTVVGSK